MEAICNDMEEIANNLKNDLQEQGLDQQIISGTRTFITRYTVLSKNLMMLWHLLCIYLVAVLWTKFNCGNLERYSMENG